MRKQQKKGKASCNVPGKMQRASILCINANAKQREFQMEKWFPELFFFLTTKNSWSSNTSQAKEPEKNMTLVQNAAISPNPSLINPI